ncbi:RES family NAD+ phosphorylase (plasmid) [Citricoccus nitrophenolicus]
MRTPDGRDVEPLENVLSAGTVLHRVHQTQFEPTGFNPGTSPDSERTRFAFFGDPPVPVLYAADTPMAAVFESILHDVPTRGGIVSEKKTRTQVLSAVQTTRDHRLLVLLGEGFRRVGEDAERITRTPASQYHQTVHWAEAAYDAGFDGMVWMSRKYDTDRAYVFFSRPDREDGFETHPDPDLARPFAYDTHLDWLTLELARLGVDIVQP